MKNQIKFKECMSLMSEVFNKEISQVLTDVYWEVLKDYSDADCEQAFKMAITNLKFFPKPVELISFIKEKAVDPRISALGAWHKVMSALEAGAQPKNDPCITRTISVLGGWAHLGSLSYTELGWIEKRFIEHYANFQQNDQSLLEFSEHDLLTEGRG